MAEQCTSSDSQLLGEFVAGSHGAFGELVSRHLNAVYSSARRQVFDAHLAEDVTQAVFVLLARKAASLRNGKNLAAWLHRATRYCAANALRMQATRRRHERRAAEMAADRTVAGEESVDWSMISAALDEAVNRLPTDQRQAIILRYFHGKTHAEVATDMGLSPDAAAKKTQRALTKLRDRLAPMGAASVAGLGAALSANGAQAAPPGLAASIASNAASVGSLPVNLAAISNGAIRMMLWAQMRFIAAAFASFCVIAAAVVATTRGATPPSAPAAAPVSGAAASSTDAPPIHVGILAIHFEKREDKPQGISRLDILKNFPRDQFDIKLITDSGDKWTDFDRAEIERHYRALPTIDGADPGALASLDMIISSREWSIRPEVISNIHDAVSGGVGLFLQTPIGHYSPGLGDPKVLDLHGMSAETYFYYATGHGWVKCQKTNDHAILSGVSVGDEISFHGLNGVIGRMNPDTLGLFASPELEDAYNALPPDPTQAAPEALTFYPLLAARLGAGRIVACQWYTPVPPPALANFPGDSFYIRCAKWVVEGKRLAGQSGSGKSSTQP